MIRNGFLMLWRFLWVLPGLVVLGALGLAATYHNLGQLISTPTDAPVKADVIVALGGDAGNRVRKAYELYQSGYAPRILLAGWEESNESRPVWLEQQGVPRSAILLDGHSKSTWAEANFAFALMDAMGWHQALVVSEPGHMRRLSWTWKRVFTGSGMRFALIPADRPGWEPENWWLHDDMRHAVHSELQKLAFYMVRYSGMSRVFRLPQPHAARLVHPE